MTERAEKEMRSLVGVVLGWMGAMGAMPSLVGDDLPGVALEPLADDIDLDRSARAPLLPRPPFPFCQNAVGGGGKVWAGCEGGQLGRTPCLGDAAPAARSATVLDRSRLGLAAAVASLTASAPSELRLVPLGASSQLSLVVVLMVVI